MAQREHIVGLDIGSGTVRVVVAERKNGEGLAILGAAEAPVDGVRKGAVIAPDQTARSIQKALHELKKNYAFAVDHAYVSLVDPRMAMLLSRGTISVSRADGEITREDVSRALEASEAALPKLGNREIVHSFPLYFNVDGDTRIRDVVGLVGMKLEVETLFIAGFTPHLKNLLKAIESAGISADDIIAAPYAASFHSLTRRHKEVGSLLLDIGAQVSTLAVFEEGALISLEIIPVGSGHVTQDIGLGFQIDLVTAEKVKRNLGIYLEQGKKEIRLADFPKNFEETFSPKKLREIVSARLGDIFELVDKHLKRIQRSELLPAGVVLVGGGARMFDIQSSAREELHLPAEIGSNTVGLNGKKELVTGPEWATAVGLCKYAIDQSNAGGRGGSFFSSPFSRRVVKLFKALIP